MPVIDSRELRSHTTRVLKQVAEGVDVTVTVRGEPVALITRPGHRKPAGVPKAELLERLGSQRPDPDLAADLAWISEGHTNELGSSS